MKKVSIDNLSETIAKQVAETIKNSIVEFTSRVKDRTPMDTGFLRGSYMVGINSQNLENGFIGKSLDLTRDELKDYELGDRVYLTNNAPYSSYIEFGTERIAPSGMMRITSIEYPQILKESRVK